MGPDRAGVAATCGRIRAGMARSDRSADMQARVLQSTSMLPVLRAPVPKVAARHRPTCSHAPSPVADAPAPPAEVPGLTSRRVKRNRGFWVAGLIGAGPGPRARAEPRERSPDGRRAEPHRRGSPAQAPAAARREPPSRSGLGRRRPGRHLRLRRGRALPGRDQPRAIGWPPTRPMPWGRRYRPSSRGSTSPW